MEVVPGRLLVLRLSTASLFLSARQRRLALGGGGMPCVGWALWAMCDVCV